MSVVSFPARKVHAPYLLYCHLWPVPLYQIFPHYFINDMIFFFEKDIANKMCVLFCLQFLSRTFLILRIQQEIRNEQLSSCKVHVILVRF